MHPYPSEYICLRFQILGYVSAHDTMRQSFGNGCLYRFPVLRSRIGLFLVRRLNICNTRRISSSRPMTGSSFPERARSFRFMAYLLNAVIGILGRSIFYLLSFSQLIDSRSQLFFCDSGIFHQSRCGTRRLQNSHYNGFERDKLITQFRRIIHSFLQSSYYSPCSKTALRRSLWATTLPPGREPTSTSRY